MFLAKVLAAVAGLVVALVAAFLAVRWLTGRGPLEKTAPVKVKGPRLSWVRRIKERSKKK